VRACAIGLLVTFSRRDPVRDARGRPWPARVSGRRPALAICAVTAALLKDRTSSQVPLDRPGQPSPASFGLIPLAVPEIRRLLAAVLARIWPPGHIEHWSAWTRARQARAGWFPPSPQPYRKRCPAHALSDSPVFSPAQ
jgi:hypothetical protein